MDEAKLNDLRRSSSVHVLRHRALLSARVPGEPCDVMVAGAGGRRRKTATGRHGRRLHDMGDPVGAAQRRACVARREHRIRREHGGPSAGNWTCLLPKSPSSGVLDCTMPISHLNLPRAGLAALTWLWISGSAMPGWAQADASASPAAVGAADSSALDPFTFAPRGIEHADFYRAQELALLAVQLEQQRAANRRWRPAALGLTLGLASIIAGSVTFARAWGMSYDDCNDCDGYNQTMDRAGLVLIPVGAMLTLVSAPLLIIRVARTRRVHLIEQTIVRLGGRLSLAPQGGTGLTARLMF